jgi:hypothetical protein
MTYIKAEFEKNLKEFNFSYQCNTAGFYSLSQNNDTKSILNVQLIMSEPSDEVIHGSRNNNEIQAIGSFKLRTPRKNKSLEFLILAFQNISKHCVEFIIIPTKELKRRLVKRNRISSDNWEIEIVFWLMPDNRLYETTYISVEAEWYYMSKGQNGRMADGTEEDYYEFLNSWDRFKMD